jgi:apolipoprotein N-acyltransferase
MAALFQQRVSLGSSPLQVYSKSHLVPYGEFIPPGFDWFMKFADIPMSSFSRGPEKQAPLAVAGQQVAVNICYEDVFGEEIIRALPQAGILANLSNTAWFGHSLAQPQHLQIAQMRAVETGRPMLRATNTGMTAIVLPAATCRAYCRRSPPAYSGRKFEHITGMTPYARFGNWGFLLLAVTAACSAARLSPRRRSTVSDQAARRRCAACSSRCFSASTLVA